MRELLEEALQLQSEWTKNNSGAMKRRGLLIRNLMPAWLKSQIPRDGSKSRILEVEGGDGTGLKAEIPWVRVYNRERSPSATEGWYLVYLFSADGDRVYLSLNQGTQQWVSSGYVKRPEGEINARVSRARRLLEDDPVYAPSLVKAIQLHARRTGLGKSYELGNVAGIAYQAGGVPDNDSLASDLHQMLHLLEQVYKASVAGAIPGEEAPEVADLTASAATASGRIRKQQGFRESAEERQAIEHRAMNVAEELFEKQGWAFKDVHKSMSYDYRCVIDGVPTAIEVKGTTSLGESVVLTGAELKLHRDLYPNTGVLVVHSICLDRSTRPPSATGGVPRLLRPWRINEYDVQTISCKVTLPRADP